MNYVWTPFQAKVRVKLIQIFLALPVCGSAAWTDFVFHYLCFTAQSTQWGHVERGQFT